MPASRPEVAARPSAPAAPRAGWYTDPAGGGYRWWDGSAWTEQVVNAPANLAAPVPPSRAQLARTPARRPAGPARPDGAPRDGARRTVDGPPAWVAPVTAGLVVAGAVLVVIGSVMPWVRATAPGVASVTRLGTDGRAGWLTIAVGVFVALEAGRWLQRRRASRTGAVLTLIAGVGCAAGAVVGFGHLAAGLAHLPGAAGPVTRSAGTGLPLIAAGCVAVFSGSVAGALS